MTILVILFTDYHSYLFLVYYKKFFDTIKTKYNTGQMEAIKDVCLSMNGICLLQGPVSLYADKRNNFF